MPYHCVQDSHQTCRQRLAEFDAVSLAAGWFQTKSYSRCDQPLATGPIYARTARSVHKHYLSLDCAPARSDTHRGENLTVRPPNVRPILLLLALNNSANFPAWAHAEMQDASLSDYPTACPPPCLAA